MESFKSRLREIRKKRGITQADLAEAAGVRRETIVRLEADASNTSIYTALLLARRLGCSVEELFIIEDGAEKTAGKK